MTSADRLMLRRAEARSTSGRSAGRLRFERAAAASRSRPRREKLPRKAVAGAWWFCLECRERPWKRVAVRSRSTVATAKCERRRAEAASISETWEAQPIWKRVEEVFA